MESAQNQDRFTSQRSDQKPQVKTRKNLLKSKENNDLYFYDF